MLLIPGGVDEGRGRGGVDEGRGRGGLDEGRERGGVDDEGQGRGGVCACAPTQWIALRHHNNTE